MLKMNRRFNIIMMLAIIFLISCKSEYDRYVNRELTSGTVSDSLIFDMHIGETKMDFFAKCWDLNKEGKISQGTGNRTARYIEPADSTKDVTLRKEMLFYGIFDEEEVMQGMDMTYNYVVWAPWNEERHSDVLATALKDEYQSDYGGNPFIELDLKDLNRKAFVKIDGNRQILIYPKDTKDVVVKIEDLNYKLKKK